MRINYTGSKKVISPQLSSSNFPNSRIDDFSLTSSFVTVLKSGSFSGSVTVADCILNRYTAAITQTTCNVNAIITLDEFLPLYSTQAPSVGTIDSGSGAVTYVGDGLATFNVLHKRRTKQVRSNFSTDPVLINSTITGLVSGSLAKYFGDSFLPYITGSTPTSASLLVYSQTNDSGFTYTRNTSSWFYTNNIDATCIPVFGGWGSYYYIGVLVSPDILIQANHVHVANGIGYFTDNINTFSGSVPGIVYFVDNNNNTISRSITTGSQVVIGSGSNTYKTDIYVSKLNAPITAGITPAKVFHPTYYQNSTPSGSFKISTSSFSLHTMPFVFHSQDRVLRVGVMYADTTYAAPPSNSPYYNWFLNPRSGDSGHPAFAVVSGSLVALGTWHSSIGFDPISQFFTQINGLIASFSSSYPLTTMSVAGFPTYT